jgi:prephenate dehydrogenase
MDKHTILIVGMGQIGASIGLALQAHTDQLHRIGNSSSVGQANHAKKIGAIDKSMVNLPSAVRKADIVVLAVPMDEIKETLKLVAKDLKEGGIVLDTSPARVQAAEWASEYFNEDQHYVGFTPILNPRSLLSVVGGIEEASDLLFQDGIVAITAPVNTSNEALKLAADLASLLRATAMFADAVEVDSYISRVHLLPQLLASSLSKTSSESPGWGEIRKFAGRPYAQMTQLLENMDRAAALAAASQLNKESIVRNLDEVITELMQMRDELESEDQASFEERLKIAAELRQKWWQERQHSAWLSERGADTDSQDVQIGGMGQLFMGRPGQGKRDRN